MRLNFWYLKIVLFLNLCYQPKLKRDLLKNEQKTIVPDLMVYMINYNANGGENKKLNT